jgi:hypothetical protein
MHVSPGQDEGSRQEASETSAAQTDLVRKSPLREWAAALLVWLVPSNNQNSNQFSDHELEHVAFSDHELDRLRFVRWLYQTGRLAS